MIVSFLPAERLDDLVAATGFNLEGTDYEYKYRWLLERIGIMREATEQAATLHDNPTTGDLLALLTQERRWAKSTQNTIASLMVELEKLRR